jgi:hypothetical protein
MGNVTRRRGDAEKKKRCGSEEEENGIKKAIEKES